MDTVMRCSAVALSAALLGILLKKADPGFSFAVTMAAAAALAFAAVGCIAAIFEFVSGYAEGLELPGGSFSIVLKIAAVGIISKITSELCRSAGESVIASMVEFLGGAVSVVTSLPLWSAVLTMLDSFNM